MTVEEVVARLKAYEAIYSEMVEEALAEASHNHRAALAKACRNHKAAREEAFRNLLAACGKPTGKDEAALAMATRNYQAALAEADREYAAAIAEARRRHEEELAAIPDPPFVVRKCLNHFIIIIISFHFLDPINQSLPQSIKPVAFWLVLRVVFVHVPSVLLYECA